MSGGCATVLATWGRCSDSGVVLLARARRFEFQAPQEIVAWNCNCSICNMKKNWHFMVPKSRLTLLQGEDALTVYRFNTMVAKVRGCRALPGACRALRGSHLMRRFFQHMFCKFCGVQCYYSPRSNPDGWGVTLACVDPGTITKAEIREVRGFDVARGVCGQRWLTTWATVRRTKLGSVSCVVWHRSILQGVILAIAKTKSQFVPQVGFEPTRDFLPAHLKCDPLTTPALWTFPHRPPNSQ